MLHAQSVIASTTASLQALALATDAEATSPELKQALGALWLLGTDTTMADFQIVVTGAKLACDAIRRLAGISLL